MHCLDVLRDASALNLIQSHDMRTCKQLEQSDRRISHVQTGMLVKLRRKLKKDPESGSQ